MKSGKLIFLLGMVASSAMGQRYVAEAPIPNIGKEGFYRISLSPDVAAWLVPGFGNLRITDQAGKEIPFVLQVEVPVLHSEEFREYEMERKQVKDRYTELILKNPDRSPINNIQLVIRNADVTKEAVLRGSDDRKNWFALKDDFYILRTDDGKGTYGMKVLDFPLSNYLFYSLQISDSNSAPLNIVKAGYFAANTVSGQFSPVPGKIVTSEDKTKKETHIVYLFDTVRLVDRIDLRVKGNQKYYLRPAALVEMRQRKLKKGRIEKYPEYTHRFEVNSSHPVQLDVSETWYRSFEIVIENEDNPPLEVVSVQALQLNRYAVAWLAAGEGYHLSIGDKSLAPATYDLKYFRDSIPKQTMILTSGAIALRAQMHNSPTDFFNSTTFIWSAILIVALLLGWMAVKMTREMGK